MCMSIATDFEILALAFQGPVSLSVLFFSTEAESHLFTLPDRQTHQSYPELSAVQALDNLYLTESLVLTFRKKNSSRGSRSSAKLGKCGQER